MIISHVADEATLFVDKEIKDEKTFDQFLRKLMPQQHLELVRDAIKAQYPLPSYGNDQIKRTAAVIRDSSFTCNTRYLYNSQNFTNTITYMMQYNYLDYWGAAQHATDILPTFWNSDWDLVDFLKQQIPPGYFTGLEANWVGGCIADLAPPFQSYFMSHAVAGNPNTFAKKENPVWSPAEDDGNEIQNTLDVKHVGIFGHLFNNLSTDAINSRTACDFWNEVAYVVAKLTPLGDSSEAANIDGEDLLRLRLQHR